LFVADGASLRRIDVSTSSNPQYAVVTLGGAAALRPRYLAIDAIGLVVYATGADATVRRLTLASNKTDVVFGQSGVTGAVDGVGTAATFAALAHLALDDRNTLFIADRGNAVRLYCNFSCPASCPVASSSRFPLHSPGGARRCIL